jgi:hypothetical protein
LTLGGGGKQFELISQFKKEMWGNTKGGQKKRTKGEQQENNRRTNN